MPRLPEHCIEYVRLLQWPKEHPFGGKEPNFIIQSYMKYLFVYIIHLDNDIKNKLIHVSVSVFLSSVFP